MTRWGVGPKFCLISLAYTALLLAIWRSSPDSFRFLTSAPAAQIRAGVGGVLIGLGLVMWVVAVAAVMRGFSEGRLCTGGIYGVCRHPVYASWTVLIVPGIALVMGNWLALTLPLFMCAVLRLLVRVEEEYLDSKFGEEYRAYKNRVPAVLPIGFLKPR